MILASTAWMNQPSTRTFRIVLEHKPEVPQYVVKMQFAKGDSCWGAYHLYVMEGEDQELHLQRALSLFYEKAARYLQQTLNSAERLLPEFEPFVEGVNHALQLPAEHKVSW